jgi:hypothetical protein
VPTSLSCLEVDSEPPHAKPKQHFDIRGCRSKADIVEELLLLLLLMWSSLGKLYTWLGFFHYDFWLYQRTCAKLRH